MFELWTCNALLWFHLAPWPISTLKWSYQGHKDWKAFRWSCVLL